MVVLVDLDDDNEPNPAEAANAAPTSSRDLLDVGSPPPPPPPHSLREPTTDIIDPRQNPNINSFSAALGCYPIALQIARSLDLNNLHDLSLTCRQFRANLLPYRSHLVRHTLRCSKETADLGSKLGGRLRDAHQAWTGLGANGRGYQGRITSGKVGQCARDLVGECRRCGVVVCRNCTVKQPPSKALLGRHRRLCRTCLKAPLRRHTAASSDLDLPDVIADQDIRGRIDYASPEAFTCSAFERGPCTCDEMVFLCFSCGNALRSSDTTYMRGWTWRTRYSTYLGGLGTGIGEGNEGVECGRGSACLAAREVEKEIDSNPEELADMRREIEKVEAEGRQWGGNSYLYHEIEGIGGVVKKKVRKRVKVGATVKEYEDERESTNADYLGREQSGVNRSWCAWCSRVVPKAAEGGDGDCGSASSSASSTKSA